MTADRYEPSEDTVWKQLFGNDTVAARFFVKNVFLKISQNSQKNTCVEVSFSTKLQFFLKKNANTGVCEFCEIFNNTFWTFRISVY